MKMIGAMMCRLGRHQRSRGKAKRRGDLWVSKCRHCGVAMIRSSEGVWSVDAPEADAPMPDVELSRAA